MRRSPTSRRWRRLASWRAWRGSSRRWRPRTRWRGCWHRSTESWTSCASPVAETRTSPRCSVRLDARAMSGVRRIGEAFAASGKRAALMPYVMAGFPTLADSLAIGRACVHAGADVIELGVPYSDPLADGPVIHAAGTRALAAGVNMASVLEVARALAPSVPVVLMCYANMVFAPGAEEFLERLARSGACGLIVPDLPLEEAGELRQACDARGLALVPLVAPTTPPERLAAIGAGARGFLYTVSVVGTTGARASPQE